MEEEPTLLDFYLTAEDVEAVQCAKERSDALAHRVAVAIVALAVVATAQHVHATSDSPGLSILLGIVGGGVLGLLAVLPLVLVWDFLWSVAHADLARLSERYRRYLEARDAFALRETRRYLAFLNGITRLPEDARAPSGPVTTPSAPNSARSE